MTIRKCDSCGKELSAKEVIVGLGVFHPRVELCPECASPVIEFLDQKNLLQDKLIDLGFKKPTKQVS